MLSALRDALPERIYMALVAMPRTALGLLCAPLDFDFVRRYDAILEGLDWQQVQGSSRACRTKGGS
ncbi:hypothetical protein NKDENANG_00103 [Candidatus Entotheonellaceae bacterium PAL068K]